MYKNDTICGIATGLGKSAIGMIRVSGPEAIKVCSEIFRGKKQIDQMETFTAAFGKIADGNETLDEAIVLVMKAPHTYTTEDVVEINCHGGTLPLSRVMERTSRAPLIVTLTASPPADPLNSVDSSSFLPSSI